jgi:glycosyltransferase involved in cell wall biosynthesis
VTAVLVHIIHPGNPYSPDPDGIVSVQRNFVKAAPEDLSFVYWGVGRPGIAPPATARAGFHAVIDARTQRPRVPLSLRFAAGVVRVRPRIRHGILRFDRIESALPFLRTSLPRVLFLHTWNGRDNRDPASESTWRHLGPAYDAAFDRIVRRMDLVYVLLQDMAEDLRNRMPSIADRIRGFSVPVDTETFRPLDPEERLQVRAGLEARAGLPRAARFAIFAGRLEGQKRPLVLPEVAAALATGSDGPVHLLVVGSGSLELELREAAARRADGMVHLLHPVPQGELRKLIGAADALVLPSAFEGLPNVVLEALACGTPVVATRGPGRIEDVLTRPELGAITDATPASIAAGVRAVLRGPGTPGDRRAAAEMFGAPTTNAPIYADLVELAAGG